jgi:N-acyl-D-amino-acid deacylase
MKEAPQKTDLVIRNALLVDGTGAAPSHGGVAVSGDRIVALGDVSGWSGAREIDAGGRALAPGFIDVHTHDDRALIANPTMECKVSQGVTTVVAGNCGVSLAPLKIDQRPPAPLDLVGDTAESFFADFSGYLDYLDAEPPATNAVAQVGHSSLRVGAMDDVTRAATRDEIAAMRGQLEKSLAAGAVGMSTGLFYPPAIAAPTEEVIELAKALHEAKALHTTHMRDESDHITDSLEETFRIGREAEIPVVISHHKCAGQTNYGRSRETLKLIDETRGRQHVGLDAYPYVAGSTMLDSSRLMGASKVIVTWSVPYPEVAGRDLAEVAADWGVDIKEAVARLIPAGGIFFMMDEEDVQRILAYPNTMIGSDGLPHDSHPHPRLWGTFPRVLGHYCRELKLFSLEEAVRKMTGLPASEFGMGDRGTLAVGKAADLVLFDPAEVIDTATFEAPKTPAKGIVETWVNGRSVWRDGAVTGERPGRALRLQSLSLPSAA